jgi:hypothetical protein
MNKLPNNAPEDDAMNDTYLWEGTGAPDPELQRLESMLRQFQHSGAALQLPPRTSANSAKSLYALARNRWIPLFAAAAILLLAIIGGIRVTRTGRPPLGVHPAWDVARIEGSPRVGSQFITADHANGKLEVGQILETDSTSRATLSVADIGQLRVEPNSRVRLIQTGEDRKRVALEVGKISAAIWATPGEFLVDTPSAVAVDLGCFYTLEIAPDGSGTLHTTLGFVGFHLNNRDSFIPTGAMCATRARIGPGTPHFEDVPDSFRDALAVLDFGSQDSASRAAALKKVLSQARARDALTLWHLLSRTDGAERALVYDRLAILIAPPNGVSRDGALRLDPPMLNLWWNALHLGDISTWRYWEQSSAPDFSRGEHALKSKKSSAKPNR